MKKQLYLDYILMQTLFFLLMGTLTSYGSYCLLQLGYSTANVGIIMSCGSLLSTLIQPISATICDKSKKITIFNMCIIISVLCVLLSTSIYIQNNASLILALSFIGMIGSYCAFEPLINSVPAILQINNVDINFGVGRAAGSLGYAGMNALLGILTSKYPYYVVFICMLVISVLLLIVNIKANSDFKNVKIETKENKENVDTISTAQFFNRHKLYVVLMLCTMGIYLGYMMVDNMMVMVVENVGGTSTDMGLILAFKACLEIPVIFFYDKIEKISSPKTLLKISAFAFIVKSALLYLSKSVTAIYLLQLVQMAAMALEIPAIVSYTSSVMNEKEAVRGQALHVMAISIASVCSSTLSGLILETSSVSTMLLVSLIITIVSALCFVFVIDRN